MHFTILALASLLTTSFAFPHTYQRRQNSSGNQFLIDYDPGCGSPAGCLYSFNLTIQNSDSTSPILASCDGTDIEGDSFGGCNITSVTSSEVAEFLQSQLFINYTYDVGSVTYADIGSVNITEFETDGQKFTIIPTTVAV